MKIDKYVDITVTLTPEPGEDLGKARDMARGIYEDLAKKHNMPTKPQNVNTVGDDFYGKSLEISSEDHTVETGK